MPAKTHGKSRIVGSNTKTGVFESWSAMIQRATNCNSPHYKNYGGRGIGVCERWLNFKNFLEDMGDRPIGMSLDRIDNNKGYLPDNCRWATRKQQQNNRRNNKVYTINGITKNQSQWLEHFGIKYSTFSMRVYAYKWPVIEALTKSVRSSND